MAKKKPAESLSDRLERAMRKAIDETPGVHACPEREYCEAVAEAAEMIKTGVEMRLEELDDGEDADG